jgi:hypothetical protein
LLADEKETVKSRGQKSRQLKGYAYAAWHAPFGRCIAPGGDCDRDAIRAHSVQREGPLRRVSMGGHVVMPRQHLDLDRGPTYRFETVGIRHATVFTGLCAEHDQTLFAPIDRAELRLSDRQQLFLYAYRAVLRETHVSFEAAAKLQAVYQKKCEIGLSDGNIPSRAGMFAVQRMIVAYETWLFKKIYDRALSRARYQDVVYDCVDLGETEPCIAVSSLFSLDEAPVGDDVARVALTVLHGRDGHSYGLLAYLKRDSAAARGRLKALIRAPTASARYLLSRLILERCDNVAINPSLFGLWSDDKRAIILAFWASTVLANNEAFDDDRLNLFDSPAA